MHADQTILFVAVAALALALIVVVVAPRVRAGARATGKRQASPPASAGFEPGVLRAGSGALAPPPPPPSSMMCPTCLRQFAAGLRYCPYDARVLSSGIALGNPQPGPSLALGGHLGKICPNCARRYDAGAKVCGGDGAALVSVN
jgi:hypothetical protein